MDDPYRCDCGAELDHPGAGCDACGAPSADPEFDDPAADRMLDILAHATEHPEDILMTPPTDLVEREREHFQAIEQAWKTARVELALLRDQPDLEREKLLRTALRALEDYMAARWVQPASPFRRRYQELEALVRRLDDQALLERLTTFQRTLVWRLVAPVPGFPGTECVSWPAFEEGARLHGPARVMKNTMQAELVIVRKEAQRRGLVGHTGLVNLE